MSTNLPKKILFLKKEQKKIKKQIKDYHWNIECLEQEIKKFTATAFYSIWKIAFKIKNIFIKIYAKLQKNNQNHI